MIRRAPRVLDSSALVALFGGHPRLVDLLGGAHKSELLVLLPAPAIAEAESELYAGPSGWESILLTDGIRALALTEHIAIDIGPTPGTLDTRHVVYEAAAVGGVVVTRHPDVYDGHKVPLLVV